MKVYQLQTPIYAESESEVVELRNAIVAFINKPKEIAIFHSISFAFLLFFKSW